MNLREELRQRHASIAEAAARVHGMGIVGPTEDLLYCVLRSYRDLLVMLDVFGGVSVDERDYRLFECDEALDEVRAWRESGDDYESAGLIARLEREVRAYNELIERLEGEVQPDQWRVDDETV